MAWSQIWSQVGCLPERRIVAPEMSPDQSDSSSRSGSPSPFSPIPYFCTTRRRLSGDSLAMRRSAAFALAAMEECSGSVNARQAVTLADSLRPLLSLKKRYKPSRLSGVRAFVRQTNLGDSKLPSGHRPRSEASPSQRFASKAARTAPSFTSLPNVLSSRSKSPASHCAL